MKFISPLSWVGGKSLNNQEIIKYFPENINNYVEPFAGSLSIGLQLMLNNRIKNKVVVNDINTDLITFWQDCKNNQILKHYPNFNSESER